MDLPAFSLALYVVWLGLLFGWSGPGSANGAKRLFASNLFVAAALWLFMLMRTDSFYALAGAEVLLLTQCATMSLPITLSYWLFGAPAKVNPRNGAARVVLASLSAVWMAYLIIMLVIGSPFLPSYNWLEYVSLGILVPTLAVLAGYFGLGRPRLVHEDI